MKILLLRVIKFFLWSEDVKPLPILDHWIAVLVVFLLDEFNFFFFAIVNWLQLSELCVLKLVDARVSRATLSATMWLIFPSSIKINIDLLLFSN